MNPEQKFFCPSVEKNCARSTTAVSAYVPIRSILKMLSTYSTVTSAVVTPTQNVSPFRIFCGANARTARYPAAVNSTIIQPP